MRVDGSGNSTHYLCGSRVADTGTLAANPVGNTPRIATSEKAITPSASTTSTSENALRERARLGIRIDIARSTTKSHNHYRIVFPLTCASYR